MKKITVFTLVVCMHLAVNAQTNSETPKEPVKIKVRGVQSFGKEPLYIVDGKTMGTNLSELNPEQIESISILKDASSTALYGPEARNGVIIVTTKKQAGAISATIIGDGVNGTKLTIRGANALGKTPLYVLDGEILEHVELQTLDPNKIQNISILKNASAVALYGPEAIDGVIMITTKKDTPPKIKN